MPTKGNLGQDPNSQESARSSQSYISNLVVIPVEEGINPVQLNTDPTPQPEDFMILTKPDGTSYKTSLSAIQGVNNGAISLNVVSSDDTVLQALPSQFDPITRQIEVDLTAVGGSGSGAGIVASGSNANGTWVKYADGFIQQCGINVVTSSGYTTFTYPIPFEVGSRATVLTAVTPATFAVGYVAILASTNFNRFGFLCAANALSTGTFAHSLIAWQAEGY